MRFLPLAALLAFLCGCDGPPRPQSPIARYSCHEVGDAPAVRYSELDDGTAFVVIGKHSDTQHMVVLIRRAGSQTWEPIRGTDTIPAGALP